MRTTAVFCLLLFSGGLAAAEEPARALLDESSFWRFHVTLRRPVSGKDVLPVKVAYRSYPGIEHVETPPPPAEWTRGDFDDAEWPRARAVGRRSGSVADVALSPGVRFSAGVISLRGKFLVTDPSAVRGLSLSIAYRGGVVAYLNGREIARRHLPAGTLDANVPGSPYPAEAFVDSAGEPIPDRYHVNKRIQAGEKDLAGRLATRDRSLGPVGVPGGLLRKGTNVLAVELHRSDYHVSATRWFVNPYLQRRCAWVPNGLLSLRLVASGTGAAPNVARPAGVQVWNHDLNDRVNVLDYGDPAEELRPIPIEAARNGAFSGQVVVGSDRPLRDVKVVPGDLKTARGEHTLPASCVRVRFGQLGGQAYQRADWFDGLGDAAPAEVPVHKTGGALLPVWVTVHVPRDAAAGVYRGVLRLSLRGAEPRALRVQLHVADWTLPDPRNFRAYVGVYQSPTSLALRYKVAEWSPEHWKLMDKSFELLGRIGNKIVNVPLSNRTQFGNDEGMVFWIRKPGGGFDYDFTVFDRYLRLVGKHLGTVDFVVLHVWHSGGWKTREATQQNTVTVVDPKAGTRQRMQVPPFGTEKSKAFWKPVLDAVRKRLAAVGLEDALCLGILSDGTAPPEVFRAFDEIVPGGARWARGCHTQTRKTRPYPLKGGGRVVCHEFCYGMAMADPAKGLPAIWKQRSRPGVGFIRHNFDDRLSLLKYRTMVERALYCGTRGIGRIGLDYWDLIKNARGRTTTVFNRWPHSSCAQRSPNLYRLAWPAPDGPAATVRYEQFRQGLQDTEAVVFVARAVGEHANELGGDLAGQCRRLLVDRMRYCRRRAPEDSGQVYFRSYHHGWQGLTRRLYAAAAKVAAKLQRDEAE